jgi:hypothetical protein
MNSYAPTGSGPGLMRRLMRRAAMAAAATSMIAGVGMAVAPAASAAELSCGQLNSGETLYRGWSISSCNDNVTIGLSSDGRLWLRDEDGPDCSTSFDGGRRATMQADGNFVVYDAENDVKLHTGTYGNPGAWISLQSDGDVTMYKRVGGVGRTVRSSVLRCDLVRTYDRWHDPQWHFEWLLRG